MVIDLKVLLHIAGQVLNWLAVFETLTSGMAQPIVEWIQHFVPGLLG